MGGASRTWHSWGINKRHSGCGGGVCCRRRAPRTEIGPGRALLGVQRNAFHHPQYTVPKITNQEKIGNAPTAKIQRDTPREEIAKTSDDAVQWPAGRGEGVHP